jgi:hypothetical protein
MTFLDLGTNRIAYQSHTRERLCAADSTLSTWQSAVFEFVRTFFLLMGIALSILTLRFALVLLNGVLH